MIDMKECTSCRRTVPVTEFHKHRITKDGLSHVCKECSKIRTRKFGKTPSGIYTRIKGRSTWYRNHEPKRYRPLEITRDNFVVWYESQPKICGYCDIPEEYIPLVAVSFDSRVTHLVIDRKDNELGYNKENMVLACHLCNFIKMNRFSYREMREIAQKYIKPKWVEFIER